MFKELIERSDRGQETERGGEKSFKLMTGVDYFWRNNFLEENDQTCIEVVIRRVYGYLNNNCMNVKAWK